MPRKPTFRQMLVSVLALWRDRSYKEIGAAAAERNEVTADLARQILNYLFRARYEPFLRFSL